MTTQELAWELVHAGTLDGHPLTEERASYYAAAGLYWLSHIERVQKIRESRILDSPS